MLDLSLDQIAATRLRLAPYLVETPICVWRGPEIEACLGRDTEIVLKLELLQRTGTFKARGALNVMLNSPGEKLQHGVTAVSAGNHAIAVAFAAQTLGVPAKVVMMQTANPLRVATAKAYGATVEFAPDGPTAFARVKEIETNEGLAYVHPFEGIHTFLATASLAAEWLQQAGALDALVVPIGGGGLMAGIATAAKQLQPNIEVIGVEPEGADNMRRSFAAGSAQPMERVQTIADSLAPPMSLPESYALCRAHVDRLVSVADSELCQALALLFREVKLAVEPAGAAATAALIGPLRQHLRGRRVGILVCGANIDAASFSRYLQQGSTADLSSPTHPD